MANSDSNYDEAPPKKTVGQHFMSWFYGFLGACAVGAVIFFLPGTLAMFGVGASGLSNVVAAATALKLNILISSLGPLATLGIAAAIAPAISIVVGVIQGIVGTFKAFIGLFKKEPRNDNFRHEPSKSRRQHRNEDGPRTEHRRERDFVRDHTHRSKASAKDENFDEFDLDNISTTP